MAAVIGTFSSSHSPRWLEEEFHMDFNIQLRFFSRYLSCGLSLRTPFPLLQLAFSPLRHFLGHANGRKGTKSCYKRRKVTTIIIMPNVFFRFGTNFAFPIFFEILSISRPVFIYSLYTTRLHRFLAMCQWLSETKRGSARTQKCEGCKLSIFFSPMSLLAIEFMNV